ncbi:PilZ domain-containing protein [Nitrospina sp. 32_T5]|uniref:PilZ domain-containing protein n=1 Tax=unclassified Nitrospina TaxID=2638683 RepID=UPI003F95176E
MFWKKKAEDDKDEKGKLFHLPKEDKRQAFRISPDPAEPVLVSIEDKTVKVLEISSGGISFRNSDFKPKAVYPVTFTLPITGGFVKTKLRILRVNREGICQCRFVGLTDRAEDDIHRYVLARQKEILRNRKRSETE